MLTTYVNEQYSYSISYPKADWEILEQNKKQVYLIPHSPYLGHVRISVLENNTLPMSDVAQRWLFAITQVQKDVVLVEMMQMEGLWNWYLSYDYVSDAGENFQGEAFLKQEGGRVYLIETAGEKAKYTEYSFGTIVSSFKLLTEQPTK